MPEKDDFSLSELHETLRGGESVVIRHVRREDMAFITAFPR